MIESHRLITTLSIQTYLKTLGIQINAVDIVLPRSNAHVYICLFVNIEIKTLGWHIQQ